MIPGPTLSVCITTRDMAAFLPLVLANVDPIADEIVVLDSGSRDDSLDVLRCFPKVRVVHGRFDGHYGRLKNAVLEHARCDWVLLLDSDELLGDELRAQIPQLIRTRWRRHFKLPRYWLVARAPFRYLHSEKHYPDHQLRLFRNERFWRYGDDQAVHEHFPRRGRGRGRRLQRGHIFHFNFLLNDRAAREAKVLRYRSIDERAERTSRMYLFEDGRVAVRMCDEQLSGLDEQRIAELVAA